MIPTKTKIKKEIKRLRAYINANNNSENIAIETRLAYFAETLLRWTLEDTAGWALPLEEAIEESKLILETLRQNEIN